MPSDAPAAVMRIEDALGAEADGSAEVPAGADELSPERVSLFEKLLVRRLQRGDARAFRELVRKHQDRVYSLCLRMLGDAHEAEDVSQEVFLAVHRHLPHFRGDCRLTTWVFRVAKNHCLNRIKYLGRREADDDSVFERTDGGAHAEGFVSRPDRPDQAMLGAEERRAVQKALCGLSPEHRLLVVLRDIEGMSYEDVGRIADLPPGTVKSRLHRARAHLAELLEAAGMAPAGTGGRQS